VERRKKVPTTAADTYLITPYESWARADLYAVLAPDFCAGKLSDDRHLEEVLYNFTSEDTDRGVVTIGLTPWHLEIDGQYQIRTCIDNDGDDKINSVVTDEAFILKKRGQQIQIPFAVKQTTMVEIRQI